jgi:uncharacterized repeat protein (TIGR03803 family)
MNCRRFLGAASAALMIVIVITLALASGAFAQTKFKMLHKFTRTDGWFPNGVIPDRAGNLYGTTEEGSTSNCGTAFKLTPNTDGSWTETVLHSFNRDGADGCNPGTGLIFNAAGNLFGTTYGGGASSRGTVFKLTPNPDGTWTEAVIYAFADGGGWFGPYAGLVFDQAGSLYGTTIGGGSPPDCSSSSCGTVFQLIPNTDGTWTENVLHTFGGKDGALPWGQLIFDQAGNLYGTTAAGGDLSKNMCGAALGCGVIFELTPNPDGSWNEKVLHTFENGKDGGDPLGALVFDQAGNLYGTAPQGGKVGCYGGCGVVFKLTPNAKGTWTEKVLHSFTGGQDGGIPATGLTPDQAGNLYGTAGQGGYRDYCGGNGCGVIFKLTPNPKGGWHETVLHRFSLNPGAYPGFLVFDSEGNLYGNAGGKAYGSVFELTP